MRIFRRLQRKVNMGKRDLSNLENPLTVIDSILTAMNTLTAYKNEPVEDSSIFAECGLIGNNALLSRDEINILNKLKQDKFSDYIEKENGRKLWYITFEGIMFLRRGGYSGQQIRRDAENIRVETLERNQRVNANRMIYLTIILAVGTSIAAWYYGIEICKSYHWFGF